MEQPELTFQAVKTQAPGWPQMTDEALANHWVDRLVVERMPESLDKVTIDPDSYEFLLRLSRVAIRDRTEPVDTAYQRFHRVALPHVDQVIHQILDPGAKVRRPRGPRPPKSENSGVERGIRLVTGQCSPESLLSKEDTMKQAQETQEQSKEQQLAELNAKVEAERTNIMATFTSPTDLRAAILANPQGAKSLGRDLEFVLDTAHGPVVGTIDKALRLPGVREVYRVAQVGRAGYDIYQVGKLAFDWTMGLFGDTVEE